MKDSEKYHRNRIGLEFCYGFYKKRLGRLKFKIKLRRYGRKCNICGIKYIPPPHNPLGSSYPTKHYCGQCVYDMDSAEHSAYLCEYEESEIYG